MIIEPRCNTSDVIQPRTYKANGNVVHKPFWLRGECNMIGLGFKKDKASRCDVVSKKILEKINKEELLVGEKLPSEHELCTMFGVSRTSVRAALQTLRSKGVVGTVQGLGSFVQRKEETHRGQKREEFKISDITSEKFQEFFEFRQAIEFRSIDFFVQRAAEEDKKALKDAIEGIQLAAKNNDLVQFSKMDYAFHMALIKGSRNSFLLGAMLEYKEMFKHYLAEISRLSDKPLDVLAKEHLTLYKSITGKKTREAKQFLFSDNMFYYLTYFSKYLEQLNE